MGRTLEEWRVSASLSNHNSEQDQIDEKLWEELRQRLREVIEDPKYAGISPMEC